MSLGRELRARVCRGLKGLSREQKGLSRGVKKVARRWLFRAEVEGKRGSN
jgi:hypothetical protein